MYKIQSDQVTFSYHFIGVFMKSYVPREISTYLFHANEWSPVSLRASGHPAAFDPNLNCFPGLSVLNKHLKHLLQREEFDCAKQ